MTVDNFLSIFINNTINNSDKISMIRTVLGYKQSINQTKRIVFICPKQWPMDTTFATFPGRMLLEAKIGAFLISECVLMFVWLVIFAVMKNPANLAKHQANPKVAPIIAKMMSKFGGQKWVVKSYGVFIIFWEI